jgi:enoyl-CoA hydratase/carnithine racemase
MSEPTDDATATAAPDAIRIARDGPVLTPTFNRPAAQNALTWGMYERLTRVCEALARQIAGHAPLTLRVTKEAIRRIRAARSRPDVEDLIAEVYGSADFREGVRAFLAKRTPEWRGR